MTCLEALYESKGIRRDVQCLSLHEVCPYAEECWPGQEVTNRRNKVPIIAHPWIGDQYEHAKLVTLGINLNGSENYDLHVILMKIAKREFIEGKRKLFKTHKYGGTLFYYGLAAYVCVILKHQFGIDLDQDGGDIPSPRALSTAFDYIAHLQHVKCSPRDKSGRGRPYGPMWRNCEKFLLHEELEILEPNVIVAMGKSDNYDCLKGMFLNDGYEIVGDWYRGEYVRRVRLSKGDRILHLYGVSHPMSFGWKRKEVLSELRSAVPSGRS